ncbi:hypothetical protein COOONC_09215 [Cooperia oncophora]
MDQVYRYELTKAVKRLQQLWTASTSLSSRMRNSTAIKNRSALRDDALSMVSGYEITEANYEMAINTLREAYFP